MKTFNRKNLKEKRKRLRNNPTQAETFLWDYLKNSQFEGRKFRRQLSGMYIYSIQVIDERNIPVFTDSEKMILLK